MENDVREYSKASEIIQANLAEYYALLYKPSDTVIEKEEVDESGRIKKGP